MGSCFSTTCTSASIAAANLPETAKVITLTGSLREYSFPVMASQALGTDYPSCFLCDSDGLLYDEYIPHLDPDEFLQLGQIYFVMPVAKLRYRFSGSVMAALAVKARLALETKSGVGSKGTKSVRVLPVMEIDEGVISGDAEFGGINKDNSNVQTMPPWKLALKTRQVNMPSRTSIAFRSRRARLSTIEEI